LKTLNNIMVEYHINVFKTNQVKFKFIFQG
jgi:hypothetical protein